MNHGTLTGYSAGCRCDGCRRAQSRYDKKYRLDRLGGHIRTLDATGSRRRLQALAYAQWPARIISEHTGLTVRQIQTIQAGSPRIRAATRDRVAAVYDALSMRIGPSKKSRTDAVRRGWVSPLCWDDDTIDDPAAKPVGMLTTTHKRVDVDDVAWLIRAGGTWDTVPARFGVGRDAIERALHRAKRRDLLDGLWRNTHGWARDGAA